MVIVNRLCTSPSQSLAVAHTDGTASACTCIVVLDMQLQLKNQWSSCAKSTRQHSCSCMHTHHLAVQTSLPFQAPSDCINHCQPCLARWSRLEPQEGQQHVPVPPCLVMSNNDEYTSAVAYGKAA